MAENEWVAQHGGQETHGFGGRNYEAGGAEAARQQTFDQAATGRIGPMASLQFGRDLRDAGRNGSEQAQRRVRWFVRGMVVLYAVVFVLFFFSGQVHP